MFPRSSATDVFIKALEISVVPRIEKLDTLSMVCADVEMFETMDRNINMTYLQHFAINIKAFYDKYSNLTLLTMIFMILNNH